MLKALRKTIGLQYARLRLRKQRDRAFQFTDAIVRSRKLLVLYPDNSIEGEACSAIIRYLLGRFSYERLVVLIREDLVFNLAPAPPIKTITYNDNDITRYFLPRRHLLSKLLLNTFDIVIDLNFGLHLTSAYICKLSNAQLRIGFNKPYADEFYNMQIRINENSKPVSAYRNFIKCLDMF